MANIRELLGDAYKEGMTFEEAEKALNGKNLADLSGGGYVSLGKYKSLEAERDDYKTKYAGTMTDVQKAEQEAAEREKRYKEIERENSIYRYTSKLSKSIKDGEILKEVANLMAEGKFEEAIERQNEYHAAAATEMEKKIKESLMQTNPQATAQNSSAGTPTQAEFSKMSVQERTKLYNENPELYKKLVNQN